MPFNPDTDERIMFLTIESYNESEEFVHFFSVYILEFRKVYILNVEKLASKKDRISF